MYQGCKPPEQNAYVVKADNAYVGSESCKTCHAQAYDGWSDSHHALAMLHASDSSVKGDFNTEFKSKGVTTRFFRKDNEFWVSSSDVDTTKTYQVLFTFGWTPLQQYLVTFPDGKLQVLNIAWDDQQETWFDLNPDAQYNYSDWMHWTRGSMTWNKMCADCHSTNLQKNYDPSTESYATSYEEVSVGCESCHGAGQAHIASMENGYQSGDPTYLVQTSDATSVHQVENCAPCHARRTMLLEDTVGQRLMDQFIPEILRPGLYHADGQIEEEVYVYGSFTQSKMYQNGVKCTDCHDVHTYELKREGNALCTSCHTTAYDRPSHTFHTDAEVTKCITCHMPGKYYMVNDFRRDHSFRVPRPDQSVIANTPNACTTCHTDQTNSWAAEAITRWYGPQRNWHYSDVLIFGASPENEPDLIKLVRNESEPGIVRATAVSFLASIPSEEAYQTLLLALQDREPLVRQTALRELLPFPAENRIAFAPPLLNDPVRAVRVTAAEILADIPKSQLPELYHDSYDVAMHEFLERLNFNQDFSTGQLHLAQTFDRQGKRKEAIEAYIKTLEIDHLMPSVRTNLARLYSQQQNNQAAIQVLEDALQLDKNNNAAAYALALVYAEQQENQKAISLFEQVIASNPDDLRAYYNLGLLHNQLGNPGEAITIFKSALARTAEADDIRYALVTIYMGLGQNERALNEARVLSSRYPNNRDIQSLVQQLQSATQ